MTPSLCSALQLLLFLQSLLNTRHRHTHKYFSLTSQYFSLRGCVNISSHNNDSAGAAGAACCHAGPGGGEGPVRAQPVRREHEVPGGVHPGQPRHLLRLSAQL